MLKKSCGCRARQLLCSAGGWKSALACTMMVVQLACCTSSFGSWWRVRIPPRPAEWIGHSESSKVGFSVKKKFAAWRTVKGRGKATPRILSVTRKVPTGAIIIFFGYWQTVGRLRGMLKYAQGTLCFGLMVSCRLTVHLRLLLWAASVASEFEFNFCKFLIFA